MDTQEKEETTCKDKRPILNKLTVFGIMVLGFSGILTILTLSGMNYLDASALESAIVGVGLTIWGVLDR